MCTRFKSEIENKDFDQSNYEDCIDSDYSDQ